MNLYRLQFYQISLFCSTYNVVHFDIKSEGRFDIVSPTEKEFDAQQRNDLDFRRKIL
jgi:hypothetical protein